MNFVIKIQCYFSVVFIIIKIFFKENIYFYVFLNVFYFYVSHFD